MKHAPLPPAGARLRVGLISDTHGLLRPEAVTFLRGSDHIVHAGDICDAHILDELAALAPLTAVRGNNDRGRWAEHLPHAVDLRIGDLLVHVVHDLADFAIERTAGAPRVVVAGHSHKPKVSERDGVLYVNPGSAGPRRFKLPIAVGELLVSGSSVSARVVEIQPPAAVGKRPEGARRGANHPFG